MFKIGGSAMFLVFSDMLCVINKAACNEVKAFVCKIENIENKLFCQLHESFEKIKSTIINIALESCINC